MAGWAFKGAFLNVRTNFMSFSSSLKLLLHFLDVYMMMNVLPSFVLKNSVSLTICNNFLRIAVHD